MNSVMTLLGILVSLFMVGAFFLFVAENLDSKAQQQEILDKIVYLKSGNFMNIDFDPFTGKSLVSYYQNEYVDEGLVDVVFEVYGADKNDLVYSEVHSFKSGQLNNEFFYPYVAYSLDKGFFKDSTEKLYLDFTDSPDDKSPFENIVANPNDLNYILDGFRKSIFLDGTTDSVEINYDSSLDLSNNLTISGWFNLGTDPDKTSGPDEMNLVTKEGVYELILQDDYYLRLDLFDSIGVPTSFLSQEEFFERGKWTHVAFTVNLDQGVWELYKNGNLHSQNTFTSFNLRNNTNQVFIGQGDIDSYYFAGKIDEVRLFSKYLSVKEAKILYSKPKIYYDSYDIRFTVLYDDIYAYDKNYFIATNDKLLSFKGGIAELDNEKFRNGLLIGKDQVHVKYQDENKYVNETVFMVSSFDLNSPGEEIKNLTFDPDSIVFINDIMYQVPASGNIQFQYSEDFPNVKFFFPQSKKTYIANLNQESIFLDYGIVDDVVIKCTFNGVTAPCDLELEYLEINTVETSRFLNFESGVHSLSSGNYQIFASNDRLGVGSKVILIDQDDQVVEVQLS